MKVFLRQMRRSFAAAWPFLMGLTFVFCVTLSIFPYVTTDTKIEFLNFIDNEDLRYAWTLQILVTVFNVGDTVSRAVRNQPWGNIGDTAALVFTYSGIIFVGTSFLIAFNVGPSWLTGKDGDWFKILNMLLFSFWNGYCGAQCAVKSPSKAPDYLKETVGSFVGTFIPIGLMIGSLISIGFQSIVPVNQK